MTQNEMIQKLIDEVKILTEANINYKEELSTKVSDLEKKVEKKIIPLNYESDILHAAQDAIRKSISDAFTSPYDNPIRKLVNSIIEENKIELREIISDSFTKVIRKEDFKNSIIDAFSHKVARTIISNNDGLFDKVSNELKQDAIFKSKITLAVSNVVNECLNKNDI